MIRPDRQPPCEETGDPGQAHEAETPVVLWLRDGPACVGVVDRAWSDSPRMICRCGGCHAGYRIEPVDPRR